LLLFVVFEKYNTNGLKNQDVNEQLAAHRDSSKIQIRNLGSKKQKNTIRARKKYKKIQILVCEKHCALYFHML